MEIKGVGCVIQVRTQQDGSIAEALTFVPNVKIKEICANNSTVVISRVIFN